MHPPLLSAGGEGVEYPSKFFKKGEGLGQDLNFERGVAGKEVVTFSGEVQFLQKKILNLKYLTTKKVYK